MYSRKSALSIPTDFHFPFEPYDIQSELMRSLYDVIEAGQIGIFESPTGTGKSLTLTCGALRWLKDHDDALVKELVQRIEQITREIEKLEVIQTKSRDWIEVQSGAIEKKKEVGNLQKVKKIIEEYEEKIRMLKENRKKVKLKDLIRKKVIGSSKHVEEDAAEEDLGLDDSGDIVEESDDVDDAVDQYKDVKIYFCSRTHSQLAQIAREIKRTDYGKEIRCISLASRQNLCINPAVKQLQSAALINERCLDMQKNASKATASDADGRPQKKSRTSRATRCPYKSQHSVDELRDTSLAEIADIEDLVSAGEVLKACPYYSSRAAIRDAQIVLLPYQMLLHRKTRIQTGIDLTGSIVIIDEAHNLLDTISAIHTTEISLFQCRQAQQQLVTYKTKYCTRFSTKNLLKINQLVFITKRLVKLLESASAAPRMLRTHQLMSEGEFFNIDLYQILEFCENNRLAQKVHGCAQREENKKPLAEKENDRLGASGLLRKLEQEQQQKLAKKSRPVVEETAEAKEPEKPADEVRSPSVIRPLLAFLESLTECSDNGQVLLQFDADPKKATMKFLLLNPSSHFEELVRNCRSIVIAGGTMRPTAELTDQLLASCPGRVRQHFYGHVVHAESVLPLVVSKGPSGKTFLFNYSNRMNPEMLRDFGQSLQNVCNVVPAGIVCFLTSYDYLDYVYEFLMQHGIISNIEKKKFVFREPRTAGNAVEKILAEYAVAVADRRRQGAILFSVVGGKLSEGLNFADDLGRCVLVVGMPYPNRNGPELQEKMRYLDATLGTGSGSEYYENLCMKAVNQCIGRSVRHINDYATVLLIDERYASDRVKNKLPQWISRNIRSLDSFGLVQGSIAKFFWTRRKILASVSSSSS